MYNMQPVCPDFMSAPLPAPFDENMVAARGRFFACVGTAR